MCIRDRDRSGLAACLLETAKVIVEDNFSDYLTELRGIKEGSLLEELDDLSTEDRLHSVFPFECMAKAAGLSEQPLGRRNIFSPSAKIALMVPVSYTHLFLSSILQPQSPVLIRI